MYCLVESSNPESTDCLTRNVIFSDLQVLNRFVGLQKENKEQNYTCEGASCILSAVSRLKYLLSTGTLGKDTTSLEAPRRFSGSHKLQYKVNTRQH